MVLNFLKASYKKVKTALTKTRDRLSNKLRALLGKKLDADTLDELEQIFYEADLGVKISYELTEEVQKAYRQNPNLTPDELLSLIRDKMVEELKQVPPTLGTNPEPGEPKVILIVGVNGNGKTTSVAKLAKRFQTEGKKVLLAATDTFRAAGMEQLEVWADRLGVDLVKGSHKSDPAAVAFDAITAAKARGQEVVFIDTAGRLHTKKPLMQELEKIRKSCNKVLPGAPHEVWLVVDATTGQNALDQAKIFHEYTPLTGLILTKIDGSARGGMVYQIAKEIQTPIQYIGVGEGEDDLLPFDAQSYTSALFD